jgi:hypothetical protein
MDFAPERTQWRSNPAGKEIVPSGFFQSCRVFQAASPGTMAVSCVYSRGYYLYFALTQKSGKEYNFFIAGEFFTFFYLSQLMMRRVG